MYVLTIWINRQFILLSLTLYLLLLTYALRNANVIFQVMRNQLYLLLNYVIFSVRVPLVTGLFQFPTPPSFKEEWMTRKPVQGNFYLLIFFYQKIIKNTVSGAMERCSMLRRCSQRTMCSTNPASCVWTASDPWTA